MEDALLLVSIPCKAMQMETYERETQPRGPPSPIDTEHGQAERETRERSILILVLANINTKISAHICYTRCNAGPQLRVGTTSAQVIRPAPAVSK